MYIRTEAVIERYNIARSTLATKMSMIKDKKGVIFGKTKQEGNIYNTDVLDSMARNGELGTNPRVAVLNIDEQKAKDTA
jgi:hypothetical protein